MDFVDHAGLASERWAALQHTLRPLTSLQAVVRWAFSLSPPGDVAEVVVQDEYTHDVVIAWEAGSYLAFDTT